MPFRNILTADRAEWLFDRMVETGSVVLRELGDGRAGEVAAQRFLGSPASSVDAILGMGSKRTAKACRGRRVLAIQDTTEITFSRRSRRHEEFGIGADGQSPAVLIHGLIACDIESEAVLGPVDATIWTRQAGELAQRGNRAFQEVESERWVMGMHAAASVLKLADQILLVGDRETDIYPLFAQKPETMDLIVRACQNRSLGDGERLFDAVVGEEVLATRLVRVAPKKIGEKERVATVELRAVPVIIRRPGYYKDCDGPRTIALSFVEAREVNPPKGVAALHWRLLSTLPIDTVEQVEEIVRLYRLRWRIEQTFRGLKTEGLGLQDTLVYRVEHLLKLSAMAFIAAVRIIQLVDARDGSSRPLTDVIDTAHIPALLRISRSLERGSQRQKNSHPHHSLAFVSWICARLGGWNCYGKPPGPKTMARGWQKLSAMLDGYNLATGHQNL